MAERFQFFAPTPQQVDYSVMQRAAEFTAAAYAGIGESIGKGINDTQAKLERDRLKQEKDEKIKSMSDMVQDPEVYDQQTWRLGDVNYKSVIDKAQSAYQKDWTNKPVEAYEREYLVKHLVEKEGRSESEASLLADEALATRTARIVKPTMVPRMRALGIDLVANGIMTPDDLEALGGSDVFESYEDFRNTQSELARALGRPADISPLLKSRIDMQNQLELLKAEGDQRASLMELEGKISTMSAEEKAKIDLRFMPLIEQERARIQLQLMTAEFSMDSKARMALQERAHQLDMLSEVAKQNFTKQQIDLDAKNKIRAIQAEGVETRKSIEAEYGAKSAMAGAGGSLSQLDKPEQRAATDIANAMLNNSPPVESLPVISFIANTIPMEAAVTEIAKSLRMDAFGVANLPRKIQDASIKAVPDPASPYGFGIDVVVNDDMGGVVSQALEQLIINRTQGLAGIQVALQQSVGEHTEATPYRNVIDKMQGDPILASMVISAAAKAVKKRDATALTPPPRVTSSGVENLDAVSPVGRTPLPSKE